MGFGLLRVGLAAVWVTLAVGLFFRHRVGAADALGGVGDRNGDLFALGCLALAAWNLARFFGGRRPSARSTTRRPLEPRADRGADRPDEYHPEFDFTRRPPADPSAN